MDETKAATDERIEAWLDRGMEKVPDVGGFILALIARIKSEQAKVQHFKDLVDQLEGEVEMLRRD